MQQLFVREWVMVRLRCELSSNLEQSVNFRRTNKIIFGQAINGVGGIFHATPIVANDYVRMMIFAMRNPCDCIDKRHCLIMIIEVIDFSDQRAEKLPSVKLLHQNSNLGGREWRHAAFAGSASLGGQGIDGRIH